MVNPSFLVLLLLVTLFSLTSARTYLQCVCSPSKRGFRDGAYQDLRNAREYMQLLRKQLETEMKSDPRLTNLSIDRRISKELYTLWEACVGNFNYEECVNADAALRRGEGKDNCYPNCDSFCNFNHQTWTNRAKGTDAPRCDQVKDFMSTESQIVQGKPDRKSVSPPVPSSIPPPPSPPKPDVQKPASKPVRKPTQKPSKKNSIPTAIPVPPPLSPTRTPQPGANVDTPPVAPQVAQDTVTDITDSPLPSPGSNDIFTIEPPATRNEGCVAVEHLVGYVLQHPQHLRRAVLCANGFCATPNHAIIVNGEWTSMKQICENEWKCVRSVRMVNNLKVAANRRAVVDDVIIVTPYDARFPKIAVWIVQMLEDVVNLVGMAVAVGSAAAVALFVSAGLSV